MANSGGLQVADRLLAPAVTATLDALDLPDTDQAAAKLAESYARALDQAAAIEGQAERVLRDAGKSGDEDLIERVEALVAKLGARSALVTIGPKLESVLVELGATPKARAALAKVQPVAPAGGGALAAMRDSRAG